MDPRRSERVSEALREEIEELLAYEMSDPRIRVASVPEVLISPDGRQARVRLIIDGGPEEQEKTLEALSHARGFIKRELTHRLQLFRMPDLYFEAAVEAELASRVGRLLRRVKRGRPRTDPG